MRYAYAVTAAMLLGGAAATVATQSPLAFAQRDAFIIEMEDGFSERCRETMIQAFAPPAAAIVAG